jgi:hypothetical protein
VGVVRLIAVAICAVALVAGCSGKTETKTTASSSTGKPSATSSKASATSSATAAPTIDAQACGDIASAHSYLILATNSQEAREPADTLLKYDPPSPVKDAIEHLVTVGGAQVDDPEFNDANGKIDAWEKQVCPS